MTHAKLHLYPPQLPVRLRVEIARAVTASGALRPADVPDRARRHPLDPPFPGGPKVDVLLEASAHPASADARDARVDLAIGSFRWTADVLGRRTATRTGDRVTISAPAPIDAPVPIALESAFGGGSSGAPPGMRQLDRDLDGAHLFPRNPSGLGYRTTKDDGTWDLPLVEDPDDRLTAERLERIADESWLAAPLPWCLDEVFTPTFPRVAMIAGMGPPVADRSALLEVRRGFLATPPPASDALTLDPRFLQDAPPWGWLDALRPGDAITLSGCLPRGATFAARVPTTPASEVVIDGRRVDVELRATRLVVRPDAGEILVVWTADVDLPRPFVPGVHRRIPIELRSDGADPFAYPTPAAPSRPDPRTV